MKKYIVKAKYSLSGYRSMASAQERTETKTLYFDTAEQIHRWLDGDTSTDDGTWYGTLTSFKVFKVTQINEFTKLSNELEQKLLEKQKKMEEEQKKQKQLEKTIKNINKIVKL